MLDVLRFNGHLDYLCLEYLSYLSIREAPYEAQTRLSGLAWHEKPSVGGPTTHCFLRYSLHWHPPTKATNGDVGDGQIDSWMH